MSSDRAATRMARCTVPVAVAAFTASGPALPDLCAGAATCAWRIARRQPEDENEPPADAWRAFLLIERRRVPTHKRAERRHVERRDLLRGSTARERPANEHRARD